MSTDTRASYTPGPWQVAEGPDDMDDAVFLVRHGCGIRIAEVIAVDHPYMMRNGEANARLIAAAPELLEALQLVLRDSDAGCLRVDTCEHIKALIHRVTE
jgi:hypothetical protein